MADKNYYISYPGRHRELQSCTRTEVEEVVREWYIDLGIAMADLHESGFLRTPFAFYHYLADDDPMLSGQAGHTSDS